MARDFTPVLKRCRALGLEPSLLGLTKKPSRRAPKDTRRKMSEYGTQMREKQRAKFVYGVLERQFKLTYNRATKLEGKTGENLLILLELRLDNAAFRLGFGKTRKDARQVVLHRHVLVNGKRVNIPSYTLKVGDVIEVREESAKSKRITDTLDATAHRIVPSWLEREKDVAKGKILAMPTRDQIDLPVDETRIVELYSK